MIQLYAKALAPNPSTRGPSCGEDAHGNWLNVQRPSDTFIWVVVKILVPSWVPIIIIRHLLLSVQKGTLILTTTHFLGLLVLEIGV